MEEVKIEDQAELISQLRSRLNELQREIDGNRPKVWHRPVPPEGRSKMKPRVVIDGYLDRLHVEQKAEIERSHERLRLKMLELQARETECEDLRDTNRKLLSDQKNREEFFHSLSNALKNPGQFVVIEKSRYDDFRSFWEDD